MTTRDVVVAALQQYLGLDDAAFQTSTIGAVMDGVYHGDTTVGELREHGDLGIGTFDALEERLAPAPRVRLRLLGEVLPPEEVPESVADVPVAGEAGVASATGYAEPHGDLVALGSLICLITMIFTLSTFVGLAQALF